MRASRFLIAAVVVALAACGAKTPGGGALPGGGGLPGTGGGGSVDPNTCGNYAASEAGAKLKAFLEAVATLDKESKELVAVIRTGCVTMGKELGVADFSDSMEVKDVCAKAWGAYNDALKVGIKGKAALKVKYVPAVCRVNIEATAEVAAKCEGKASADVGAKCDGTCNGKCEGQCAGGAKAGGGGAAGGGECKGQCNGTCKGKCEGKADVKASGQCKAKAQAQASASMECTPAKLEVALDAKLVVDKGKADMVVKALQNGVSKILDVKAKLGQFQAAVETTVSTAGELKAMGPKLFNSFGEQAMCISGQVAAAVSGAANIQANVNVSVSVSAEASGSVGG